jgi:hypothetical protein
VQHRLEDCEDCESEGKRGHTDDGFIADNTLHRVLADGALQSWSAKLLERFSRLNLTFSRAAYLARLRPYETHGRNQDTTPKCDFNDELSGTKMIIRTSEGVGETVKDTVRPFALAVDERQIISVAGSASLHGLSGTGLLVVLGKRQ